MSDEPTAEDDFGKFFDNLADLAAADKRIPANFGASDAVVQPTADPVAVAVPPEPAATAAVDPAPDPAAADPGPVAAPADAADSHRSDDAAALNRLADLLDRRAPPTVTAQQPLPQPQPVRLYTDEEVAFLQTVEKDYPDLLRAQQLLQRGTTVQNNAYLVNRFNQALAPTQEVVDTVANNYHRDTIYRAVPDYDKIYDPVVNWVATDPSIAKALRATFQGVIANGDVSDVKWLTDEWRKATGKQTPPVTPTKPANELSEAAKQAAASLAPVVSRATAVVTSADPSKQDFDGGWDWAISQKKA